MALFDRNQRQRSSCCSTATFVVFVALCLLGLWMMSSTETVPAAISASSEKVKPDVKEEDSSIDATNTVKQDSANVVAETTTAAAESVEVVENPENPAADAKGDGGKASSKNQSFDDENGKTETGELVKPEAGETDGSAAQGKSVEEEATAAIDERKTGVGQDKNAEQMPIDTNEAVSQDKNAEETVAATGAKESSTVVGGGGIKNQTFDDENGKMDGVDLVKDDGNKTLLSEESAKAEGAALTVKPLAEVAAAATASENKEEEAVSATDTTTTTATTSTTVSEEEKKQDGDEQKLPAAEALPNVQAELLTERAAQNGSFTTQAAESTKEKETRAEKKKKGKHGKKKVAEDAGAGTAFVWKLCNSSAGADYIPCLDNEAAIKKLRTTSHYEHRERHCPAEAPTCLVPAPVAYREPIRWPHSRDKIWYHNVPHTKLAAYKGHQNWVKVSGEHLMFPGGGTQFKHGALHYIDLIQEALPEVAWGRRSRLVLDVGCGVASFGGYLFDRDALTMSLAPKDEHEAQVQFALERGIPGISAVMGTLRLPFPANVFDVVHCARCRVPWHIEGGMLLLELNRLLRPGGFFVWSATPVYQKLPEDVEIWDEMVKLTKAMCWEMVTKTKDTIDLTGLVIFRKPESNGCYEKRGQKEPALCEPSDDPNAAWNITLRACMHRVPEDPSVRGSRWPELWPERLGKAPYWLDSSQVGVYGKRAPDDFVADLEHWKKVLRSSYLSGMGIDWKTVRNVMDMRAVYGGFAAALREMKVWVMNVVTIDSPDTLPVIYERGLFGIYHDWCESFSTYPRSYDLLHADHLFSKLKPRCKVLPVIVEVDRILRPNGKFIVRDDKETVDDIQSVVRSLQWEVRMIVSKRNEAMLCARKTTWRPTEVETR
ncbi:probable methyltransferase PMT26 [Phragmites australis]|uniref:probable methyltransferase PMT26 n=1 Tax=Phragmites australis TaxID=29695 RepID=UPI002D76E5A3|nr:probable methyltransferase PMT26 [Phragmites australis]